MKLRVRSVRAGAALAALWSTMGCVPRRAGGSGFEALALRLDVSATARRGEAVPLKLAINNRSERSVELNLAGRPAHDFIALTADEAEVWRWSHGQVIQEILQVKTLQPGETLQFEGTWQQVDNAGRPVAAGVYLLRGVLNLEPPERMATTPVELRISP